MGTSFFKGNKSAGIKPSGQNFTARSIGASMFAGRAASGRAAKDLGAASGLYKAGLKPTGKTAATAAPGPKKV